MLLGKIIWEDCIGAIRIQKKIYTKKKKYISSSFPATRSNGLGSKSCTESPFSIPIQYLLSSDVAIAGWGNDHNTQLELRDVTG